MGSSSPACASTTTSLSRLRSDSSCGNLVACPRRTTRSPFWKRSKSRRTRYSSLSRIPRPPWRRGTNQSEDQAHTERKIESYWRLHLFSEVYFQNAVYG